MTSGFAQQAIHSAEVLTYSQVCPLARRSRLKTVPSHGGPPPLLAGLPGRNASRHARACRGLVSIPELYSGVLQLADRTCAYGLARGSYPHAMHPVSLTRPVLAYGGYPDTTPTHAPAIPAGSGWLSPTVDPCTHGPTEELNLSLTHKDQVSTRQRPFAMVSWCSLYLWPHVHAWDQRLIQTTCEATPCAPHSHRYFVASARFAGRLTLDRIARPLG